MNYSGGTPITALRNDIINTQQVSDKIKTIGQKNLDSIVDELNQEILLDKKKQLSSDNNTNNTNNTNDSNIDNNSNDKDDDNNSNDSIKTNGSNKSKKNKQDNVITNKKRDMLNIPDMLKDPILIVIIYVILSQDFAIDFFSNYIKYIKPNDSGSISFVGVTIYGIIFGLIFMVCKLIINKLSH